MSSSKIKLCFFAAALAFSGIGCGNAEELKKDTADFKKITITHDFLSEGHHPRFSFRRRGGSGY